jgi:hypothetical protein
MCLQQNNVHYTNNMSAAITLYFNNGMMAMFQDTSLLIVCSRHTTTIYHIVYANEACECRSCSTSHEPCLTLSWLSLESSVRVFARVCMGLWVHTCACGQVYTSCGCIDGQTPVLLASCFFARKFKQVLYRRICGSQLVIYSLTAFTVCATMCHSV